MAHEDFQASNWWKTSSGSQKGHGGSGSSGGSGFDGGSLTTSAASCTAAIADVASTPFTWGVGFPARPLIDSNLQLSGFGFPSPSMDWNQTLLSSSSSSGRAESSFQVMLQEDLNSRSTFSSALDACESSSIQLKDMNPPFFFENSIMPGSGGGSFPLSASSSPMIHGLLEPDSRHEESLFDSQHMLNHLQITNSSPFWNASTSLQPFELPIKSLEGGCEKKKNISTEPAMKKIRVETPSPLPAFKVRKEKLGDRITALQQLVSPFGKTDTASVLHEAIEYIKFLHDQVSVLSTPYLKNGHPMQQQQPGSEKSNNNGEGQKHDLRSRGLCLVPISSTYPMASETTADFWTPTFGGTYR